jgi:hypothetical protein
LKSPLDTRHALGLRLERLGDRRLMKSKCHAGRDGAEDDDATNVMMFALSA